MDYPYRTWYLTLIATFYLVLCSLNLVFLAARYFHPGTILPPHLVFTLGGAAFGWLYFFQPAWGHKGLIALTLMILLAIGESDHGATIFYFTMLALLLLPIITRRQKPMQKPSLAG